MIRSFLNLDVYKESFQLSLEAEELLKSYPASEKFLLVDQMKRSSRGIPALIAEGYARRESLKDFQKYLRECVGEANEMMNHLLLSKHKGYIKKTGYAEELIERYNRLGKKLTNLKNNWQNFK
ncbi:MAG: four helix bundle protein [Candidatus Levybacteria bacterium]|nr:four helix bundle protein [Candidatus Levybacteria bacterium]